MASICRCIWALEAERLGVDRLDPVSEISSDDMIDKVVVQPIMDWDFPVASGLSLEALKAFLMVYMLYTFLELIKSIIKFK